MTEHCETVVETPSPPPVPGAEVLEMRLGHHRMILAMAVVVLAACFILPAPEVGTGEVHLPWLDVSLPSFCMLKREYGIDCPGCGLTRCFISMGHGQVASAWDYHPTGVLLFVLVAAQVPYRLYQIRRLRQGRREFSHWSLLPLLCLLVVAILGQWVLRMTGIL